jgi:hypothetical protein
MCKVYIICKIEKPLTEFHKHKRRKDGYTQKIIHLKRSVLIWPMLILVYWVI